MRLATLTLTLALAASPAVAQMVRPENVKAVSAHVQVIPDGSVGLVPNVGLIVGSKGVLVVDTGLGAKNGALVAQAAAKAAPGRKIYLVATHAHPEHDLGAQAFPGGSVFIRSNDQVADAEAGGMALANRFAQISPVTADLLKGAEQRKADVTFDKDYTVDLGGVSVKLIALGPNHTRGDTAIWVAADKVLFSGDVSMKAQPAMMAPATTIAQWNRSLDTLEALKPAVVVPSHGPIGGVDLVRGYRAYLKEVAERTGAAKAAGLTQEAATAQVIEAMIGRYPDRGRLAGAVLVAWRS